MSNNNLEKVDFSSMTKEEVIAYFKSKNAKLEQDKAQLVQDAKRQARDIKRLDRKSQKLEDKNKELTKKANKLEKKLATTISVTIASVKNINAALKRAGQKCYDFDGVISEYDLNKVLKRLFGDFQRWMQSAQGWLGQTPFVTGPEKLGTDLKSLEEKELKELENYARSVNNNKKKHSALIALTYKAIIEKVEKLQAEGKEVPAELLNIYKIAKTEIKVPPKPKKPNRGKQAKGRFDNSVRKYTQGEIPKKCTRCGSRAVVPIGTIASKLMAETVRDQERLNAIVNLSNVFYCNDCGKVFIQHDERTEHPVMPNHIFDALTLIRACECIFNGIALNKFEEAFVKMYEFGTDSIARELHTYVTYYIMPLVNIIIDKLKDSPVLLSDETEFRVLQSQGRGYRGKEDKKDIGDGTKKGRSKNYILAVTSGPAFPSKVSLYQYVDTRSGESLGNCLKQFDNCRCLVTDSYSAYPKIADEDLGSCKHQNCIIHMRREFFKAFSPFNFSSQFENLSTNEILDFIEKDIENNCLDGEMILGLFSAISKIYQIEEQVDYQDQSERNRAFIMQCRNKQRELMDFVSSLVRSLSQGKVKQDKSGKYSRLDANDKLAGACVYFLNQEQTLKEFLNSTIIPPDTNVIEGQIRPLTILRKNIYQKNADWGMHDLCAIYTVMQTLKRNDIDAEKFLIRYSNALYYHCLEKGYEIELRGCKDINKQIRHWDFEALSKDFDFKKFLPFN